MTAPNLLLTTSVYGKTTFANVTTVTSNVLQNAASSNTNFKINNILLTNTTGSNIGANIYVNRADTNYTLGGSLSIPATSVLVVLGKDTSFYLEEGDTIQMDCSANGSLQTTISYELIS